MHDTSIAGVRLHAPVAVKTSSMVVGCPILKANLLNHLMNICLPVPSFGLCYWGQTHIETLNVAMCSDDDDAMMNAMVITFQAFRQEHSSHISALTVCNTLV